MLRIAGLASNRGRNLIQIHDRAPGGAGLSVVLTNDADAPVLGTAADRGVPTAVVEQDGDSRRDHERRILDALSAYPVDLVCLDGYMRLLSDTFLDAVPTTLNVHPSLLPAFPGMDAWGDALDAGVRVTGCTVHVVTNAIAEDGSVMEEEIDAGPIVTQEPVPVYEGDDRDSLKRRVLYEGEFQAYPRAVRWFAEDRVTVDREARAVTVAGDEGGAFPDRRVRTGDRVRDLRTVAGDGGEGGKSGEGGDRTRDPDRSAALYADLTVGEANAVDGRAVTDPAGGFAVGDYEDADAALRVAAEVDGPAAAVATHATPVGCAAAEPVGAAVERALATDPEGATGGALAMDRACDARAAEAVADSGVGVVVAPGFADGAVDALDDGDRRVLAVDPPGERTEPTVETALLGGAVVRERADPPAPEDLRVRTDRALDGGTTASLLFALRVAGHAPSKAVVLASGTATTGIGAGQPRQADALGLALRKAEAFAGEGSPAGTALAADAPIAARETVEAAAAAGVEAVVHPDGPDGEATADDAVAAANDHGIALVTAGTSGRGPQ